MVDNYLTKEDLQSSIRDERLDHILDNTKEDNDVDAFALAASEAQAIVRDHLIKYAIDIELAKDADDRHKSVVFYMKNITLYVLYERAEGEDAPANIIKNYNDTIETLQEISKGKLTIGLPLPQVDTDGDGEPDTFVTKFRGGGGTARRNNF